MAKQANAYGRGPWDFNKLTLKEFTKITNENRQVAVRLGRIFYVISGVTYRGTFCIDPCFTKAWWKYPKKPWESGYPGHIRVFIHEGQNNDEYRATYKAMLDKYIEEGTLFIRMEDPILEYFKE